MNVAAEWLRSGERASLDGIEVIPLAYPQFAGMPVSISRGQATAYVLEDRQSRGWILKKFLPGRDPEISYIRAIRGLIPEARGFESGSQRRILSAVAIGRGYGTPAFTQWIEKTILMPRVAGIDWLDLAEAIRVGVKTPSEAARVAMCRSLVSHVRVLESVRLSHRDLSITNVFIDPATWNVHLIDWDTLYHPSLTFPSNTPIGTPGYIAPFVLSGSVEDVRKSWCPHADRFAMALLCAEFLTLERGSCLTHDGGLFEQQDLYARHGATIRKVLLGLVMNYPAVARLVERALHAETFAGCPSPDEWLAAPPLAAPIPAPEIDPESVISRFEWHMNQLKQPPPPAPPLPEIDFSAIIRATLLPPPDDKSDN